MVNPMYLPIDELHPLKPSNYYGYTKLITEKVWNGSAKYTELNMHLLDILMLRVLT